MRITNRQLTSTYLYNANKSLENYSKQNEKIASGRAFTRISENVSVSKKALQTRLASYRNEQYQENVDGALEQVTTAETSLMTINDQVQSVQEMALRAVNGTNTDETTREVFIATLEETKEGMLNSLNQKHLDKYILGGTNNREVPFRTDEDGNLLFNGVNVDDITMDENGRYIDAKGEEVQLSRDTYIDIGYGLTMNGDSFDETSVIKISFSGVKWTGHGMGEITYTDKEGYEVTEEVPNNVFQIINEMQDALAENDTERLGALNSHLTEQYDNLLTGIAELGVKSNRLETAKSKLQDEAVNLDGMQQNYEGIEDTDEIVLMEEYKYSWLLTLQFGSSVLPQSLMEYVR